MSKRVVITGLGAVSPLGLTFEETWQGLLDGKCGIDTITAFDPAGFTCTLAGQVDAYKVRNFVPKSYRKAIKLMSRDIELTILAAAEAFANSGLVTKATDEENTNIDPPRTAINVGAGLISCDLEELAPSVAASLTDGEFDIKKWGAEGLNTLTPLWLLKYLPNMLACHVGIIHDIRGPSNTITCGEVGGLLAIAEAAEVIMRDASDVALAGGCEAKVNPLVMLRQCLLNRATANNNDKPNQALRPFDADASGSVFGEGAGLVVLEEIERAKSRGAKIYAEIAGIGESNSLSTKYESLEADGKGLQIAIEKALADAGINADQLDLIIPHGTGIAADDKAEATAIARVLESAVDETIVWPTKSMLSYTGSASGGIDIAVAAMAISQGKIGSAKNCDKKADGCELNISNAVQEKKINYALCCGYTFGGQVAAIVLKKVNV